MGFRSFASGAAAVLVLLALPADSSAQKWGEFTREELFSTHFPEASGADAVILRDHGAIRIDSKFRLKFTRHRQTKIFTEAGCARAVVRIPYRDDEEIHDFRAHTIVPPEREVKVEKKHVRDERSASGRVRVFEFPDVQPGVVLEYSYELRTDRIDSIDPWLFQNEDFTRESRLDLQLPAGLSHDAFFGWTAEIAPSPETSVINDPKNPDRELQQTTWRLTDLPAHRAEPLTPNAEDHRLRLYVQLHSFETRYDHRAIERSWEELGEEVGERWERSLKALRGAEKWAGASVDGIRDPEGKAQALYRRVRDGIRSEAPADFSGLESPDLDAALKSGRGSPLAKNLVLLKLLRDAGLDATAVLVTTRDRGTFQSRWHDLRQFDHAILKVSLPTGTVFLDASEAHCPFGVLPTKDHVKDGLAIRAGGGEVVAITWSPLESSRRVSTTASMDRRGNLSVRSVWTFAGHPAIATRQALDRSGERPFVEEIVTGRFPGATIDSVRLSVPSADDEPVEIAVGFRVPDYAARDGYDLSCATPFVFAGEANPLAEEERAAPVSYPHRWLAEESVIVRLPRGLHVPSPPADASVRIAEASFSLRHESKRSSLNATRRFRVLETSVPRARVPALADVYARLAAADTAGFLVKRQPVGGSASR